ncbi:beta-galactosidase [Kineosporia sp. NBRC 101677]|uniref:beta-galactosidase n=1 Tax=Kineosporia sp. NBRC 101677 TaxID=3032197 RepID=UPI0024A45FC7|nr:beta-galactosidase [Kineosporia sp. NBRC 101677]GLY17044.1 beta-galactosidase [Kineosporia sp. NBRC 101677]
MLYGADYNPEQWPEHVWDEDVERMREASVTTVSLGIFSWSRLQPTPTTWDFDWLDRVIGKLHEAGIGVNLATATASPPPWMSVEHPDVLAVDENGATYWHGSRQHYSPASPTYRRLAAQLVTKLAERYAHHPAVVMWHVNNEYGCHLPSEYSDAAQTAFRGWLQKRYGGVAELNEAWGTAFWSQRYGQWEEVMPPLKAPYSRNPAQLLDYHRFMSDMWLECYLAERDIIRAAGATQPISTNMMGAFKPGNYQSWAPHIDVITDDCYPDPLDPQRPRNTAFQRDLMRSLKPGTPWLLMEQATDAVNWRRTNVSKQEGQLAAETAQSVGRGADGIFYFQWRQSRAGAEKFHSAMLPHAGTRTRTWQEASALGGQLAALPELPQPKDEDARVALVFDWENWWAIENPDHPTTLDYLSLVREWYGALHRRGVMVDIVPPEQVSDRHHLAIAPFLYLLRDEGAAALTRFVESGGVLCAGPFSDIVDANDRFRLGGFLQQLGPVLGVGLEDFRALPLPSATAIAERAGTAEIESGGDHPSSSDHVELDLTDGSTLRGTHFAEALWADDAEVLATFRTGPSATRPALTRRVHESGGQAWYVGTMPDPAALDAVIGRLLREASVAPVIENLPEGVEVARRGDVVTVINHGPTAATVSIPGTELLTGEEFGSRELAPQEFAFVKSAITS